MYRSSSTTRDSDDLLSRSSSSISSSSTSSSKSLSSFKPITEAVEQLPTYNPHSFLAKKEFNRLRSAETAIHFIPLILLFCALILYFFSTPELDVDL